MKHRHDMPFGAHPLPDGRTRFRLWAPSARRVELCVPDGHGERVLELTAQAGGWREITVDAAGAGTRYRFRIDGTLDVPDPASRFNPHDIDGPSMVVDAAAFEWTDDGWRGRPWHEAIVYELHVGTFTPAGTYAAAQEKLDHLVDLGVSAIELMPIADFPGVRNWGYDGVLPFAPDARYGNPDDLKHFICAAHARGLMVLLDVVYNHFGPQGNFLPHYAERFFTQRHKTPWGAAINFDDEDSAIVRRFYLHNALYWLEEYRFDGLRLDAVHAIKDDSTPHILDELAQAVHARFGADRHVHLILENDANQARHLARDDDDDARHDAQWNDDVHHCLHVLLTGEHDGYYSDYAPPAADPRRLLARALVEGYAYQADASAFRGGARRGERSAHLPATCFIDFLQNHDQIGNRALGERIGALASPPALHAALAIVLLSPHIPMLFMGEEWNAGQPFLFFCDFDAELAARVRDGRREEFSHFARFRDRDARLAIPDPGAPETFDACVLDWSSLAHAPHAQWLERYRMLLGVRRREIVPRLRGACGEAYAFEPDGSLHASWRMADRARLRLWANLQERAVPGPSGHDGRILYRTHADDIAAGEPWSVIWSLEPAGA